MIRVILHWYLMEIWGLVKSICLDARFASLTRSRNSTIFSMNDKVDNEMENIIELWA
jgi:hypothetical protein